MKEVFVEVSKSELLPEYVSRVFEEEGRKEDVLGVCEYEGKIAGGTDSVSRKVCAEDEALFCGGTGDLD